MNPLTIRSRSRRAQAVMATAAVVVAAAAIAGAVPRLINALASGDSAPRQVQVADVSADPAQQEALADGVVTQAEYDAAVERTLACVGEAGGEVIDKRYEDWRDSPVWNFVIRWDDPAVGADASPYDECWIRFSRDVEAQWVAQHAPSDEERAANEQAALECAAEEGLNVTTIRELGSSMDASDPQSIASVRRCLAIAYTGYDPLEQPPSPSN